MLAYGLAGWCIEVLFTGVSDAIRKHDHSLRGETYLWMFPIYGAGGVLLEQIQRGLSPDLPRPLRAVAYVGGIYLTEYTTGLLLRKILGACPWDYQDRGINVHGLVRLDFAPFWYACALAFEPMAAQVERALVGLSSSTSADQNL
jgi:uncharacterized membrane protein